MYFLAVICPPIAVLMCDKPVQAVLNVLLTMFFWIPGIAHALLVVGEFKGNERRRREYRRDRRDRTEDMAMLAGMVGGRTQPPRPIPVVEPGSTFPGIIP